MMANSTNTMFNSDAAEIAYKVRLLYDKLVSAADQVDTTLFAENFYYEPAESHPLVDGPIYGVENFLENSPWSSPDWDQFAFRIDQINAGDKISLQGYCAGIYKPTGKLICAQVLHIWSLHDGLLTRLLELTDTEELHRAIDDD